jgi:lipoprotein signal peptidase
MEYMSKSRVQFFSLLGLLALLTIDQALKYWARSSGNATFNPGIFLGFDFFNDPLNLNLFIVFCSLLALFSYFILLVQFPRSLSQSIIGLTLLAGGIAGNTIDRILWLKTTDFIYIPFLSDHQWNIADLFLWAGFFQFNLILFRNFVITKAQLFRSTIIILPRDQWRLIFTITLLTFLITASLSIFSWMFIRHHFVDFTLNGERFLSTYVMSIALMSLIICTFTFIFLYYYSLKIMGPVYGFLRKLREMNVKFEGDFKRREDDYFAYLDETFKELKEKGP